MGERITIASDDPEFATWLERYVGTVRPFSELRTASFGAIQDATGAVAVEHACDVLLLHAAFGNDPEHPGCAGLAMLRRLRPSPGRPVIVAIAEQGNELTAVAALRQGAEDYLPRALLTPERLGSALKHALQVVERRAAFARRARAGGESRAVAALTTDGYGDDHGDGGHGGGGESFTIATGTGAAFTATISAALQANPYAVVPRYEVLRVLGRSAGSTVYLATAADLDENVALKVSADELTDDGTDVAQRAREMLAREYQLIAAIDHPCVVDIYDYGVHDGREYLAMEYFPRGDLRARMQQPLSVAAAVAYVRRIATALQVVHDAGVVHRDLKPQNVMLREDDDIVLIDFGLSKDLNGTMGSTRTGVLRGSPYYMCPEQAQGLPVDRRGDLYSLGVMLYEMLVHRKPFHGETAIEILQHHVGSPPPRLPGELAGFQPVLDRLLAKRPNDRYDTATELVQALASA